MLFFLLMSCILCEYVDEADSDSDEECMSTSNINLILLINCNL